LQGTENEPSAAQEKTVHHAMKTVGEGIKNMKFNTAIATLMSLVNDFDEMPPSRDDIKALLSLLSN
jgi:leucyl-tRNA synthetase